MNDQKTPWNPSRRATARVKNPFDAPEECPYCIGHVEIKENKEIYGRNYGEWPWVYTCGSCDSYVGMHPFTNIPLGTMADAETREARKRCKAPFEALHKNGRLTRNDAYERLADKLGIKKEACHFGWFDAGMCEKAAKAAREIFLEVTA